LRRIGEKEDTVAVHHVHLVTAMTGSKTAGAKMCCMNLYAAYAIKFPARRKARIMMDTSPGWEYTYKSHIVKHWMSAHPELNSPLDKAFEITAIFKDCLSHLVAEALRINHSKDELLNTEGEYMGNSIIRLVVEEERRELERMRSRR
jgi:hypothetical protein